MKVRLSVLQIKNLGRNLMKRLALFERQLSKSNQLNAHKLPHYQTKERATTDMGQTFP